MEGFRRITRELAPALLENIERSYTATAVERHGAEAEISPALLEKVFPSHSLEVLSQEIQNMEDGRYRARDIAGDPKIGTRHVHDFVIDKSAEDTRLFVVDPEHALGKNKNTTTLGLPRRGDLRPKVCILYGARLTDGLITEITALRYKSSAIAEPRLLKPDAQLSIAEELLRTGNIPEVLIGKENKITFRLDIRKDSALAQSQLSTKQDLERLLAGEQSSEMAEGQLKRYAIFMNYFARHLQGVKEGVAFEPLPG